MSSQFELILNKTSEIGTVQSTSLPIVYIKGLPDAHSGEIVLFESGTFGQVRTLEPDAVGVLVFSKFGISVGTKVVRTGQLMSINASNDLLGRSLNSLGSQKDGKTTPTSAGTRYYVENEAKGIKDRVEISKPLLTGVSIVDMLMPLGKGQRELLIGDKQTGKTSFALQIMLNQIKQGTLCVYACIGKKKADIDYIERYLDIHNVRGNVVLVLSEANDSLSNIYLTPYTAMSIAEYLKDQKADVLVILDDMSTHAKFYREISLLSNKFPGRDSYPGDIFYTHSRLVERAGNFHEGSITLLPLVHTVEGDISGYIQTNLMSMTDGHIYFDKDLFYSGQRPSVDIHMSVTRVGRQTQSKLRWSINRELTSFFVLYKKTENFVHFGAELSEGIRNTLEIGKRILHFFKQTPDSILSLELQIFFFIVLWSGLWNSKDEDAITVSIKKLMSLYGTDVTFREKVNSIINHDDDLNTLLGKFMREVKQFDAYIK